VTIALTSVGLDPFFAEERYRDLADRLAQLAPRLEAQAHDDAATVAQALGGEHGLYAHLLPEILGGAAAGKPDDPSYVDVRALVLVREMLGHCNPLADAIFAVQGLGSYPIVLAGSEAQKQRYLPEVLSGQRIAAFGLTEPEAGSDVASMQTRAQRDGDGWLLDGDKTLISNVPIAKHYVVFANADPSTGRKGISAFVVERDCEGLELEPQPMSIHHPIGKLRLRGCKLPGEALLGEVGGGFKLAMQTLDAFRISVGAAANGMAAAALGDALTHVATRRQFGKPLAEQQMVQAYLAEMATELDAARLLVARAAYGKDVHGGRRSAEAAMAKMFATEAAQGIIDKAVQLHGGRGVLAGTRVEALYRDIRPLRIYEGTTEIQKLIIARALLSG
jgi:acyl-CoA dehydrogenase